MQVTLGRLAPRGFWGRSMEDAKRFANITMKLEGIKGPSGPYLLHSFHKPGSISDCLVSSDAVVAGFSTSNLEWSEFPHVPNRGYARFHGTISAELPADRPEVKRTGYATWRTRERGMSLFGLGSWSVDPYVYLGLRIRSDGRPYFVNIQTDGIIATDLHQHRLFARQPGQWETVFIKWADFVRTNLGQPVQPQTGMLTQKISTFGIGLTDRVPGPFELQIESLWATTRNETDEDERQLGLGSSRWHGGVDTTLLNRRGERVRWEEGEDGGVRKKTTAG